MPHPAEDRCLALAARTGHATISLDAGELEVERGGRSLKFAVPAEKQDWALLDFHHGLPGRARGDQREMLLAAILQDASPSERRRADDLTLRERLRESDVLPAADTN